MAAPPMSSRSGWNLGSGHVQDAGPGQRWWYKNIHLGHATLIFARPVAFPYGPTALWYSESYGSATVSSLRVAWPCIVLPVRDQPSYSLAMWHQCTTMHYPSGSRASLTNAQHLEINVRRWRGWLSAVAVGDVISSWGRHATHCPLRQDTPINTIVINPKKYAIFPSQSSAFPFSFKDWLSHRIAFWLSSTGEALTWFSLLPLGESRAS